MYLGNISLYDRNMIEEKEQTDHHTPEEHHPDAGQRARANDVEDAIAAIRAFQDAERKEATEVAHEPIKNNTVKNNTEDNQTKE